MSHWFSRQVGEFYDQATDAFITYDDNIHYGYWPDPSGGCSLAEATAHMTDQLIERLDVHHDQRVLDVGCGVGTPALRLARATGAVVVGINVSHYQLDIADAIARAEGLSDRLCFEYADAMDLPYTAASFDRVWALESMLHMPDRGQVLREISRVLRPGGRLAIADIVLREKVIDEAAAATVQKFCAFTHARSLERIDTYPALVENSGLELLEISDVSAHTRPMGMEISNRLRCAPDFILKQMGEEAFIEYEATWKAMCALPQTGYALLSARKP